MSTHTEPTVGQFMTTMPATVDEELLLVDAQERMFIDNIRHLVVCRGPIVVGMLSSRDVSDALAQSDADPKRLTVADAMTPDPFVCSSKATLSEVARSMEAHRYGCVVVHDGNHLAGVFTTIDALRALREVATGRPARRQITPNHLQEPHDADQETRARWHHITRIRERRDRTLSNYRGPRAILWRMS